MSFPFLDNGSLGHDATLPPHHGRMPTPLTIYLIILVGVFIIDALEAWYSPLLFPLLKHFPRIIYDPFFTTILIAPLLWLLAFRPLQRALLDATVRNEAVKSQVVEAVVTIDLQGKIISINPAAERIFGYAPAEISGKDAAVLFCDASLSATGLEALSGTANTQETLIHEVTCHRKDGHLLRLEISVSRLLLAGTQQFLVIMRDITRRLELEREAREIQNRLIQTNKMTALGLMVSGVAHEINNPNNYILSNAQLLERSCGDMLKIMREYQQENGEFLVGGLPFAEMERHLPEMITGIIDGTQRINSIVNDLKVFSRQDSGAPFEEIDLNLAVKAALMIVSSQVGRHTRNFRVQLAPDLPNILASSQKIGQVVINLLMNACQALPGDTAAILLETCFDRSAAEVLIRVTDEGSGIPEESAQRVMEPFYSTRAGTGGTGLGLSISDAIVKEHSGCLTFRSVPGRGTTFEVRLPIVKREAR